MYEAVMGRVRNDGFSSGPTEELVTLTGRGVQQVRMADFSGTGREVCA